MPLVTTSPNNRSPLAVVVAGLLFGAMLVPWFVIDTSSEPDVATPEYSNMAMRNGPIAVSFTVTVFAPPLMFSA